MAYDFLLSSGTLANGRTVHYAQLAGSGEPKFVIGYPTLYDGNRGLYNTTAEKNLVYKPEDYFRKHGFWAYFIYPTANAESKGSFFCLNTYDRARFTFTFMQYAAHVPNGDFVKFFRLLLARPEAGEYFPRLVLQMNRICYRNADGSLTQLEDDRSSSGLMNYFNPSLKEIENQELICAARMVHWAKNNEAHREVQVQTAVEHFRNNMVEYDKRFDLDNAPAKVCLLVCDIRHQGRATNDRIAAALNTGGNYEKAYQNLLTIGEVNYAGRIKTLRATVSDLLARGLFDKKYSRALKAFA